MSEKKFQKIVSGCAAIILTEAFLFNYVDQFLQAVFGIIAFACAGILIYTGLKEERPEQQTKNAKESSLADLSELEYVRQRFRSMAENLMHQSAALAEAEDKLRRYKFVVDSFVADKNHNKCHMRQRWVCEQICEIEGVPFGTRQDIPMEEMYYGCAIYVSEQYPNQTPTQIELAKKIKALTEEYLGLTLEQNP